MSIKPVLPLLFLLAACECNPDVDTLSVGTFSGTWTIDPSVDNISELQELNATLNITSRTPQCSDENSWFTLEGTLNVTQGDQQAEMTLANAQSRSTAGARGFVFQIDIQDTFLQSVLPSPIDPNPDDAGDTLLEVSGNQTDGTVEATARSFTIVSPVPTYGRFNLSQGE